MEITTKQIGKVKFFNESKGYGFITMDDGHEVFVHISNLKRPISMDMNVEFEIKETPKGNKAINVTPV
jgi:CspA family cold shock protein